MTMDADDVRTRVAIVVEEQVEFTLAALCRASGAAPEQVHELVIEGVLLPAGRLPEEWRFAGSALPSTRTALRLAHDLDLGLPAAALVMALIREIQRLRARLPAD